MSRANEITCRKFYPKELHDPKRWSMPIEHCIWLFEGTLIADVPVRPNFSTALDAVERRLLVDDGKGHELETMLPHFNAGTADFVVGDQVVIMFHTRTYEWVPSIYDPETGKWSPGMPEAHKDRYSGPGTGQKDFFTPDFNPHNNWGGENCEGRWSYILNLDTSTCWAIGKGTTRNRHYVWPEDGNYGEHFNRQRRINVSDAYIQVMNCLIEKYAGHRKSIIDCNYRAETSSLKYGDNLLLMPMRPPRHASLSPAHQDRAPGLATS